MARWNLAKVQCIELVQFSRDKNLFRHPIFHKFIKTSLVLIGRQGAQSLRPSKFSGSMHIFYPEKIISTNMNGYRIYLVSGISHIFSVANFINLINIKNVNFSCINIYKNFSKHITWQLISKISKNWNKYANCPTYKMEHSDPEISVEQDLMTFPA